MSTRGDSRKLSTILLFGCLLIISSACGVAPAPATTAGSIGTGIDHTCARTPAGGIKCWGSNDRGQLGDGTTTNRNAPVNVVGLSSGVATISAGDGDVCVLTPTGGVKCWGENATPTTTSTPVDLVGLSNGVVAISAGSFHACLLTQTGAVKCWGWNAYGQCGDGTATTSVHTPVDVVGLSNGVAAISAGDTFTCALTQAGAVKCWGGNNAGQLGDGTTTDHPTPVDVVGLSSGVRAISAGGHEACALTQAGAVKCWGKNDHGQLGDGTTTNRPTPVDVVGLSNGVAAISVGSHGTACALTQTGAVKCWGGNSYGQLGDGTTTDRHTPVDVVGLSRAVTIVSAGGFHTCALIQTGGVKCWGSNHAGQLGDGTTTDRHAPVDVIGFP